LGTVFEVLLAILVMPTLGWRWLLALSTIPLYILLTLLFRQYIPHTTQKTSSFPYLEKEQTDIRELHTYKAKESKNEERNGGECQQPAPA